MFGLLICVSSTAMCCDEAHRIRTIDRTLDDTYKIGRIDRLVLKKAVMERGLEALKSEIDKHIFDEGYMREKMPPVYISKPNPYIISQVCTKQEQSELSQAVFGRIHRLYINEVGIILPGNQLNHLRQGNDHRIDYCTNVSIPDGSDMEDMNTVQLITSFFHKKSLQDGL